MNNFNPIYTEKTECQDCYKCVRECPVKAIKFQHGAAALIPELCVLCGHCVNVCPAHAKRVRDDLGKVKLLLKSKKKVIASLAPSYKSEFNLSEGSVIIHALKELGFYGVSETALGAQQVSAHIAQQLSCQDRGKLYISSACPVIVDLITHYIPTLTSSVTGFLSPMLSHCKMLRKRFGESIGIVFIGPCIAKKREADSHPNLIDTVITFEDLKKWFEQVQIDINNITCESSDTFIPGAAEEGSLYPVDGGMSATIKSNCTIHDPNFVSFSGLKNVRTALEGITPEDLKENLFIEALACEGGCINGPLCTDRGYTIKKRLTIINTAQYPNKKFPRTPSLPIAEFVSDSTVKVPVYTENEITDALRQVGKLSLKDEFNCGGCGYDSCRDFSIALLSGKAERSMCVTYMRKLAQNKAGGLIRTMPSGVVIVNEQLRIIESNRNFASLFGSATETAFDSFPGLENVSLQKVVPFHDFFKHVLDTGEDIIQRDFKVENRIIQGSIFTIEPNSVVGGVFADITTPSIQKEQVVQRARDVIRKNLTMVQKIAYLLGENASETEIVLDSIIESFKKSPGSREPD
jgi:iron only hydrogenase large subunit-like protein